MKEFLNFNTYGTEHATIVVWWWFGVGLGLNQLFMVCFLFFPYF